MSTAVAVVLFCAVTAYAIFGGADFGAGFWDLVAGGAARGERPRRDRSLDRPSLGGQPRLVDLHLRRVVDGLLRGVCLDHLTLFVPLTLAAFGIVLRGTSFAFRKTVFRTGYRRNFGAVFALSSVLVPYCMGAVAGGIASGRIPPGGEAGDPWTSWMNPTSILGGVLAVVVVAYLAAVSPRVGRPQVGRRSHAGLLPPPGHRRCRRCRCHCADRHLRAAVRRPLPLRRTGHAGLPLVILSAVCGVASLVLLRAPGRTRRTDPRHRSGRQPGHRVGHRPVALHPPDQPDGLRRGRALRHPHRAPRRHRGVRAHRAPRLHPSSTSSDQKGCCPRRAGLSAFCGRIQIPVWAATTPGATASRNAV